MLSQEKYVDNSLAPSLMLEQRSLSFSASAIASEKFLAVEGHTSSEFILSMNGLLVRLSPPEDTSTRLCVIAAMAVPDFADRGLDWGSMKY